MTFNSGVMHKLQEKFIGSAVTDVTFSNLSINIDKYYRLMCFILNPSGSTIGYDIYFNDDTTNTNYWAQTGRFAAGVISAARVNEPLVIDNQVLSAQECMTVIDIYRSSIPSILYTSFISQSRIGHGAALQTGISSGYYDIAPVDITSITIHAKAANGIGVNSAFNLLRISSV